MHPELLKLGPITIYTYGFMMASAFLTGYFILKHEIKQLGEDPIFASDLIFWGAIGGIGGSKLFFLVENFSDTIADPIGSIFSGSGLVFHGGLIAGTITVVSLLLLKKKSLGDYGDIIGPVLLLGQGIGRIGCFFAGCCHGDVCHVGPGVSFPGGSQASFHQYHEGLINSYSQISLPVYPTQLYETFFNVTIFFLLIKYIRPRLKKKGSTFALFLIIAGVERFFLEFIRINPISSFGLTHYQLSSIFLVTLGAVLWIFFVKTPKDDNIIRKL